MVYDDTNRNGERDESEMGIESASIRLTGTERQAALTRTTETNAAGVYTFIDVPVGEYELQVVLPPAHPGAAIPIVAVSVNASSMVTVPPLAVTVPNQIHLPWIERSDLPGPGRHDVSPATESNP